MSKIDKTGNFSKKYNYVHCENGEYYLLPKDKIPNAQILMDFDLPEGQAKSNRDMNIFNVHITTMKFLAYLFVCVVISFFLNQINVYLVILLWSMNLHEFTHIGFSAVLAEDKLVLGVKIKYYIFLMFYISNRTIYAHTKRYRICYYTAGIATNFFISLISWTTLFTPIGGIYPLVIHAILQVNVMLLIVNLFPFLFTDGFSLLQEILEIYTLREQTLTNFFNPMAHMNRGRVVFAYYIFVVISWIVIVVKISSVILHFFQVY